MKEVTLFEKGPKAEIVSGACQWYAESHGRCRPRRFQSVEPARSSGEKYVVSR